MRKELERLMLEKMRAEVASTLGANALTPEMEATFAHYTRMLTDQLLIASQTEIDRCLEIVRCCSLTNGQEKTPAGLGWNKAIEYAATALEDWKRESAEEMSK